MRDQNQDVPLKVAFLHRIIFDVLVKPLRLDFWIPIDAELRHEARNDPEQFSCSAEQQGRGCVRLIGVIAGPTQASPKETAAIEKVLLD